ncbi:hypothetical protein F5144DRAFT_591563 [Chaetomium tenue]|uniref:Uncharacterized protein n=1 Tax=Chaetomium tenue TaxID=1854479 RepID=A0ACB7PDK0_9PEZI|nr:hypothetical protein F5144DRAFT_591563 [Chaetomium globosum]
MASTVSAIPLSKFQPITATTISLGCILAYNAEIPGCAISDFVAGNACSASCVRGLERVEANLASACDRTEVSEASVLGQALLGNLVELLCPGTSSPENPVSSPTAAPTTFTTRRSSSPPPLTFTPVQPSSTTTTAVTETEEPETSTSTSRASPTTTTPQTFIQSSPPTSSPSSSSTSTPEPPAEDSGGSSGGGTPFDNPFDNAGSGSRQATACWVQAMAIGLGVGLLLWR